MAKHGELFGYICEVSSGDIIIRNSMEHLHQRGANSDCWSHRPQSRIPAAVNFRLGAPLKLSARSHGEKSQAARGATRNIDTCDHVQRESGLWKHKHTLIINVHTDMGTRVYAYFYMYARKEGKVENGPDEENNEKYQNIVDRPEESHPVLTESRRPWCTCTIQPSAGHRGLKKTNVHMSVMLFMQHKHTRV